MAYAYKAANWCDECGDKLKDDIDSGTGKQDTGDTNDYPQYGPDDGESDSPNHCNAGEECLNALELDNGTKVGAIVSGLTDEGAYYVRSQKDSPCVRAWLEHYGLEPFTVYLDNLDDREGCVMCEVHGQGALRWAKGDQTIAGCRWEGADRDDFAYAMPMDHPGLVAELEKEGYRLNLEAYSAPEETTDAGAES
jgi:hypothetical protein